LTTPTAVIFLPFGIMYLEFYFLFDVMQPTDKG
jgi:hypothetical protein